MKLKHIILGVTALFLASCEKEAKPVTPTAKPTIENVEIGMENSKKAYAESDLHLEAIISSEVGVKSVRVQVIPRHLGNAWFVDKTYLWEGKKEGELHSHYDIPKKAIPAGATEGVYDVIITVTDANNLKISHKDTLTVINDPNLPKITNGSQKYNSATKKVTLKAKIIAPNKIKEIKIRIGSAINHTFTDAEYIGKTEVNFEKEIDGTAIANPNHFHSYLTVTDEAGKIFTIDLGAH